MSNEVKLPELGEGINSGVIAAIVVQPGQTIQEGDPIVEIETDKAVLPVPSSISGTCEKVLVAVGDEIQIGATIATITSGENPETTETAKEKETEKTISEPKADSEVTTTPTESIQVSEIDIILPELGEGIESGVVSSVLVKVGSQVQNGDPVIELETDKAVLPVPAPESGTITHISTDIGSEIKVGQSFMKMKTEGSNAAQETKPIQEETSTPPTVKAPEASVPKITAKENQTTVKTSKVVAAGPATRKFARELGVDLGLVKGSRKSGRIDIDDVKRYVKEKNIQDSNTVSERPIPTAIELPDFSKFGPIRRETVSNLRKIISERMVQAWTSIPHVFQYHEIDVTELARVQSTYAKDFKEKGSTASPTNFFIKAMAICLKEFPIFNSSFDSQQGEIIYKDYFNIGVAVDTPTGLIVPVLKGVDQMTIFEIGKNLKELAKKTRERKVVPEDLTGGCMTLSNLGGIGGTHFTPIINAPEVAILGVGKSSVKAEYIDGQFVPRTKVQVCLSYDHRVIDGADGARFITRLSEIVENFERTLLGA